MGKRRRQVASHHGHGLVRFPRGRVEGDGGGGAASRPLGGAMGLWGHGLRDRQMRGPVAADTAPATAVVRARRYRCRHCKVTLAVLPRGSLARRHYSAGAIVLACALYGMLGETLASTRGRISPWRSVEAGWPALERWLRAVERGVLFPRVRPWPRGAPGRISPRCRKVEILHAFAHSQGRRRSDRALSQRDRRLPHAPRARSRPARRSALRAVATALPRSAVPLAADLLGTDTRALVLRL